MGKRNTRLSVALAVLMLFTAILSLFTGAVATSNAIAVAEEWTSSYTGTYYDSLDTSLRGEAFRDALDKLITDTHKKYTSYDGLKSIYATTDKNPNGSGIKLFYTGTVVSSYSSYGANREHVWPKDGGAAFSASSECGSDAHHLRPCDQQLNSTRGSLSFGEVAQTESNIVKQGGATKYENLCYKAGSFFYPGVGYRGATARILMYVQTRWGEHSKTHLQFVDGSGKTNTIGDFKTLYKWHLEEPPTEEEKLRNEAVYAIQGNRNPFIDHPEYAYYIYSQAGDYFNNNASTMASEVQALTVANDTYGNLGGTETPTSLALSLSSNTLESGTTAKISLVATPSNANRNVTWTSSNNSVATVANGTITAVSQGTAVITATSTVDNTISAKISITVTKAKEVSFISVDGTPIQTSYTVGSKFSPNGLTVTVTYDDGTVATVDNSACTWLDSTTGMEGLSQGTTSVICRYKGVDSSAINGISVEYAQEGANSITITSSSFSGSGAYAWTNWTSSGVSGQAYIYPGNKERLQFNNSKDYCYLYNTTAIPGGIQSISIEGAEGKNWEIITNNTPYDATSLPYPTSGTSQGEKTLSEDTTTWAIEGNPTFFAICYKDVKVAYLDSITITYGGTDTKTDVDSIRLDAISASLSVGGTKTITATASGEVTWISSDSNVATVSNGTITAVGNGTATITATCGTASASVAVVVSANVCNHTFGEWTTTAEGKAHTCTKCGYVETAADPTSFTKMVAAIDSASDNHDRYQKIVKALNCYDAMSADERQNYSAEYAKLKQQMSNYNQKATTANNAHLKACSTAFATFTTLSGFAALAYIFKKLLVK